MSVQKARGTAAESAIVSHLRVSGFPQARRIAQSGALDKGDVHVCDEFVIEAKNYSGPAAVGQPGPKQLAGWLAELEAEKRNGGYKTGALVVKRKGTARAGDWWAYVTLRDLDVINRALFRIDKLEGWTCMTLDTLLAVLRANGYQEEAA